MAPCTNYSLQSKIHRHLDWYVSMSNESSVQTSLWLSSLTFYIIDLKFNTRHAEHCHWEPNKNWIWYNHWLVKLHINNTVLPTRLIIHNLYIADCCAIIHLHYKGCVCLHKNSVISTILTLLTVLHIINNKTDIQYNVIVSMFCR